jgi:hypothetical protein
VPPDFPTLEWPIEMEGFEYEQNAFKRTALQQKMMH